MALPKKPPGTAVDKRNGAKTLLTSVRPSGVERLPAPRGLSKPAKAAWEAFWDDRPAALMTPAATVVLLRWADALDRYLRTTAEADKNPLVTGSQNQEVMNPLYRIAEQALSTVTACEKQLGIGGLNASQLGLAAITEARSLQDMNARYSDDDGGEAEEEQDPRLRVIEGDAI